MLLIHVGSSESSALDDGLEIRGFGHVEKSGLFPDSLDFLSKLTSPFDGVDDGPDRWRDCEARLGRQQ